MEPKITNFKLKYFFLNLNCIIKSFYIFSLTIKIQPFVLNEIRYFKLIIQICGGNKLISNIYKINYFQTFCKFLNI